MDSKQIIKYLSDVKEPLVGLDFLLIFGYEKNLGKKIKFRNDFFCCLCSHEGAFKHGLISHFTSKKHRLKFLKLNFNSIVTAMKKNCFQIICEEIVKNSIQKKPRILGILNDTDKSKEVQSHLSNVMAAQQKPTKQIIKKLLNILRNGSINNEQNSAELSAANQQPVAKKRRRRGQRSKQASALTTRKRSRSVSLTNNVQNSAELLESNQQPIVKKRRRRGPHSKPASTLTTYERSTSLLYEISQNESDFEQNQDEFPQIEPNYLNYWCTNNVQNSAKLPAAYEASTLTTRERSRSPLNSLSQNESDTEQNQDQQPLIEVDNLNFCTSDDPPYSITSQYFWEQEWGYDEIFNRYKMYEKISESHPKYTETWNFFWLKNFCESEDKDRQKVNLRTASKWWEYWKKRLQELKAEEELEMRVRLRQKMRLPSDPDDEKKLKLIKQREKMMIKKQSPRIYYPHISLHLMEIQPEDARSEKHIEMTAKEKDSKARVPLSDLDVQLLFNNYENLDSKLKNLLFEFMEFLEESDPKRYQSLLKLP